MTAGHSLCQLAKTTFSIAICHPDLILFQLRVAQKLCDSVLSSPSVLSRDALLCCTTEHLLDVDQHAQKHRPRVTQIMAPEGC